VNITSNDAILLTHATLGVLGTLSALWVFIETLSAREQNAERIQRVALTVAFFMCAALILGGGNRQRELFAWYALY
jgi:hypothetical protein